MKTENNISRKKIQGEKKPLQCRGILFGLVEDPEEITAYLEGSGYSQKNVFTDEYAYTVGKHRVWVKKEHGHEHIEIVESMNIKNRTCTFWKVSDINVLSGKADEFLLACGIAPSFCLKSQKRVFSYGNVKVTIVLDITRENTETEDSFLVIAETHNTDIDSAENILKTLSTELMFYVAFSPSTILDK